MNDDYKKVGSVTLDGNARPVNRYDYYNEMEYGDIAYGFAGRGVAVD
jgi:hypothetical protein